MNEKQINDRLEEAQAAFYRSFPAYQRQVKQAFDLARTRVSDILLKHMKDGKIIPSRYNAISQELASVENALYRDLLLQTTTVLEEAAESAGSTLNEALVVGVVASALLAAQASQYASTARSTGVAVASLLLAYGIGVSTFLEAVLSTVFRRTGTDGKDLRYRLRKLASDIITEIKSSLRKSIRNREDYATIQQNVLQSFLDVEYRADRITETEAAVAYRTAIAHGSELSGIVQGLKIVDYPHGTPGEHERHKCYEYAHADDYGMGEGVYPVNTRKIRNPHPQCRSRLFIVLKEGVLNANR